MKYLHKSQEVVNSKSQIKLTDINDGVLVTGFKKYCLTLKCSTVNFELMGFDQQEALLNIYQDFLNSLDISCQILVRIRQHKLNNKKGDKKDPRQQKLNDDHQRLIKVLVKENKILTREFYLVLSLKHCEEDIASAIWQLKLKAQIAQQNLQKMGIKADILTTVETIKLLKQSLNPLSKTKNLNQSMKMNEALVEKVSYKKLTEEIDHLKINKIYTTTLVVKDYPLAADANCLAELINFDDNIDISYHIEPVDSLFAIEQLNRKITELESQKRSQLKSGKLLTPQITDPLESALSLRAKLLRNQEMLFQVAIYITALAVDKEALTAISHRLKNLLASRLFITETAKYQQLPAWEACLPIGLNNLEEVKRNFDSSSLALTFPLRSLELIEKEGILYGLNKANNSLIMIDRFSLPNANSVIFAQSGSGKSYTMKLELLRHFIKGVKIIVIDPENEYQTLCKALKGNYLEISKDSRHTLNPLQLISNDQSNSKLFKEKLPALIQIIELMVEDLSIDQKAALDKALLDIYLKNPQPLLSDLQKALRAAKQEQLCLRLEKFINGSLSDIFASHTNINLDNPLTVFNIQHVNETLRPLIMMIIANFVNEQVISNPSKRLLVIDEAWLLLQHQAAKEFLNALIRRARKYYLGVVLISQQVADFYNGQEASALISQASLRILLRQDSTQIKVIADQLDLSEYECKFLSTCAKGEALIIANNQHVTAKILASPTEHPLITTDPKEIYEQEV